MGVYHNDGGADELKKMLKAGAKASKPAPKARSGNITKAVYADPAFSSGLRLGTRSSAPKRGK